MQFKKIIIIVLTTLSATIFFLLTIPMQRTYRAEIVINSDELITYRTLLDTVNWKVWYIDDEVEQPVTLSFEVASAGKSRLFNYDLNEQHGYTKKGQIKIVSKNRWNTQVIWSEKLVAKKNIVQKFRLLFHPSEFRASFLQNMVQFKSHIEHPGNIFGGLTFERKEIPANNMVILSDTIAFNNIKDGLTALHEKIIASIAPGMIKHPGNFLSQYEMVSDSTVKILVGVVVEGELDAVKMPLGLLEMDEHPAVIIHTDKCYTDLKEDISVMYEWLKKNDTRPATSYWVKHTTHPDLAHETNSDHLTIIQEVYSIK